MYKIVFVVAVFALAFQGAFSGPTVNGQVKANSVNEDAAAKNLQASGAEDAVTTTVLPQTTSTVAAPVSTTPKNGASSSQICVLLFQISSLALIAKHVIM